MTEKEMVLSDTYMDIIADTDELELSCPEDNFHYQQVDGDLGVLYINRSLVPSLNMADFTYRRIPKLFTLEQHERITGNSRTYDTAALMESGVLQVQRPPLALTGSGVVLGFIDTGIRYTEDAFRNADGTSRILSIWDQTIQTGTPPEGMAYGTEYTQQMINQALRTNDPRRLVPSWDSDGHGTAVASVAAGSTLGGGYRFNSPAPDSQIIVVKCKEAKPYLREYYFTPEDDPVYSETDLILAIKYLEDYGIAYRRPVIIHFGMGISRGSHAAGSALSAYINRTAARRNRIIVSGWKNQGYDGRYYSGSVRHATHRPSEEDVEIKIKEGTHGFIAELWSSLPNDLSISIRSPSGEVTNKINLRTDESRSFSFAYERTMIQVDRQLATEQNGGKLLVLRIVDPSPGIWVITVGNVCLGAADHSPFHIWLPKVEEDKVSFLTPDPCMIQLGPPDEVISVSAYDDNSGSFCGLAGRGNVRTDDIKPDISAPGANIDTILGKMSGSGMASAITAGAAAQFMQWAVVEGHNIYVESREFRSHLIIGAKRSSDMIYPNREWGYGKLNIAGTFEMLAGL